MLTELAQTARSSWRAVCVSGPGVALAVLAPKCPLCAAAWLSALGLGAQLAPWLRPVMLAAAALIVALPLLHALRKRRVRACCCSSVHAQK